MTLLLALLAGATIGSIAAAALTLLLGDFFDVSDFGGARGMLAL